jgi:hypothetical protein
MHERTLHHAVHRCALRTCHSIGLMLPLQAHTVHLYCEMDRTHFLDYTWLLKGKIRTGAMVQAVRSQSVSAKVPVRSQVNPWEMCGRQSGIRVGFIRLLRFFPACIIQPILVTRLHLNVALTGRTNRRSLGTFKMHFRKSESIKWNFLNFF